MVFASFSFVGGHLMSFVLHHSRPNLAAHPGELRAQCANGDVPVDKVKSSSALHEAFVTSNGNLSLEHQRSEQLWLILELLRDKRSAQDLSGSLAAM